MSFTVVVTRNVRPRFRGFLASVMCEIAPGVYTAPRMNPGVRERTWGVLERWWARGESATIVMTWPDPELVGGQQVRILGAHPDKPATSGLPQVMHRSLVERDGVFLARTPLTPAELHKLGVADPDVPF